MLVTYTAVLSASVFFRADGTSSALAMLAGMVGLHGVEGVAVPAAGDAIARAVHVGWLICLYGIVWGLPNTQQIMRRFSPAIGRIQPGRRPALEWQPDRRWAVATGIAAAAGVLAIGGTSEFLYFRF